MNNVFLIQKPQFDESDFSLSPDAVLSEVASYLPLESLCRVQKVSRRWYHVVAPYKRELAMKFLRYQRILFSGLPSIGRESGGGEVGAFLSELRRQVEAHLERLSPCVRSRFPGQGGSILSDEANLTSLVLAIVERAPREKSTGEAVVGEALSMAMAKF